MEILLVEPIINTMTYRPLIIIIAVICAVVSFLAFTEKAWGIGSFCACVTIACIILVVVLPSKVTSKNQHYVIEITDDSYYKTLIDKGYNLNKLYENRNIYELNAPTLDE